MNSLLIILITTTDTSKLIDVFRGDGRARGSSDTRPVCVMQYLYTKLSGVFVLS